MNLRYKEKMLLLEILKEAKIKQANYVSSIDNKFLDKENLPMSKEKESYWLAEQAFAYDELDCIRNMIETVKEII